jgi:hypothetical protein
MLHSDTYGVINNDTMAHLKAFQEMESQGYVGLYGGQEIVGWIINHSGLEPQSTFMYFNFGMLALAGVVTGIMVYILTGNKIAGLLTMPLSTVCSGGMMQLFYCGTIFNVIAVMILVPLSIIAWYFINKKFGKWWSIGLSPLLIALLAFHPSLGGGLLSNNPVPEGVLNPFESLNTYFGMYNFILLTICLCVVYIQNSVKGFNAVIIVVLSAVILCSGIIGFVGLSDFSSRVIINMTLFMSLLTVLLMGIAVKNSRPEIRYCLLIVTALSAVPGLFDWIMNSVVKGLPANVIIS